MSTLTKLLAHPLHRHLVKLLVFAAREVPAPLVRPLLEAAADTVNPSFNKHFVAPCCIVYGRRRVVAELVDIANQGNGARITGATNALYWGAIPREGHQWPDERGYVPYVGEPDEPVEDLIEEFDTWAASQFLEVDSLDLQRSLVSRITAAHLRETDLGQKAIVAAREHHDSYIRDRVCYDLGESKLIPCLPHHKEK